MGNSFATRIQRACAVLVPVLLVAGPGCKSGGAAAGDAGTGSGGANAATGGAGGEANRNGGAGGGPGVGGGAAVDASVDAAAERPADAALDASGDGARDAYGPELGVGPCAHDLRDPNCWALYDVSALHATGSFFGGAFDGRHVYFVSWGDTIRKTVTITTNNVVRYDTQAAFDASTSWQGFNTVSLGARTYSFRGAVFDGRHLYLVPFDPSYGGNFVTRYDTQASFVATSSWATFDHTTLDAIPDNLSFVGGAFDGRYVYLSPNSGVYGYWRGDVLRYDPQASFTGASAWSSFDTHTMAENASGYRGAVFDGRYIYFMRWGDLSSGTIRDPAIARYDTQGTFTSAAAWTLFDPRPVTPVVTFAGGCFDGRYVYFAPNDRGIALRYDTQGDFTTTTSWSTFEMRSLDNRVIGTLGATFDGRYVYFIPEKTAVTNFQTGGVLVRYDTQASFQEASAWTTVDLTTLDTRALGFAGAVFDGRWLYLVPESTNLVLRYDARTPPALPPRNAASFF